VYWADVGVNGFGTDGAIWRCAKSGCGQSPTLIKAGINIASLALGPTDAYWVSSGNGNGTVWTCPLAACAEKKLADVVDGNPYDIAVSGTTLVWTVMGGFSGAVYKCTLPSCAPEALAQGASMKPGALVMDATNVYFANDKSIQRCAIAGCNGAPDTLFTVSSFTSALATDGAAVYFTASAMGPGGALVKCAVGGCGGGPTVLATEPTLFSPGGIALDATSVYWTDYNKGTVSKAPK
jgi:hypothetical protein